MNLSGEIVAWLLVGASSLTFYLTKIYYNIRIDKLKSLNSSWVDLVVSHFSFHQSVCCKYKNTVDENRKYIKEIEYLKAELNRRQDSLAGE